jgi:hypothetical protein
VVAVVAAIGFAERHLPQEADHIIFVPVYYLQVYLSGKLLYRFQTATIFLIGMDVGIIEKTENLRALILQNLKRIDGTGCTTDVEQNFQDGSSSGELQLGYCNIA